ncbi:DUF2634 domain-containing protein [Clostridium scatologenes]|uniref:DUF2634 domain-containing protein n=1 Tax=Clostridium scatologenes TaxID=1548 RepID=A0A0E3GR75_CLOSL|nr:DUF2634 domain-containing protein [Clostridium scatologenes]AKA69831.1 hypothetical protein CSCA_2706 [Clostridium scatologenes]
MSIFPDYVSNLNTATESSAMATSSIPKEYAWDFEKNNFLLKDGKFQVVEGKEALKIWMWKALHTMKMTYSIYSNSYGHDLDSIIGQGFSNGLVESEAKRLVRECLSANSHILRTEGFKVNYEEDKLSIEFTAITDQGKVNINV